MSPSKPPTAKATMMERDEGSTLGGQRARRKLGGPEMYNVARRAFTAGFVEGKRRAKRRVENEEVELGEVDWRWRLRDWTTGHSW